MIEYSCVSFMLKDGKCPKSRWGTHRCPFNIIKGGSSECMYSGRYKGGQKTLTNGVDITEITE
jgi:hypothetical protein